VIVGSLALTKMSRRLEERQQYSKSSNKRESQVIVVRSFFRLFVRSFVFSLNRSFISSFVRSVGRYLAISGLPNQPIESSNRTMS